jgi:hypothetical protein
MLQLGGINAQQWAGVLLPASQIAKLTSEITAWKERALRLASRAFRRFTTGKVIINKEETMDIDGSYFFTEELEDLVLASAVDPMISPHGLDDGTEEGGLVEGETLPEVALQAIRSWFGF